MSNTTQDGRLLSISTPLGKDFFLLNRVMATEEISNLFSVEVELFHEENEAGYKSTIVDPNSILGQAVTIAFNHRDATARTLSGIFNRFSQGERATRFTTYYATIVPNVWILTQNIQSRIFQHKTVPEILTEVFKGFEVSYELQGSFKPRNFCIQYNESDFDFASRLMEEEGFYYYFDHTAGTDKMVVANTPQSHRDCPGKSELEYYLKVLEKNVFVSSIGNFKVDYKLQTGKVTNWDHNFELPHNKLDAQQPSLFNVGGNQKLELYEYPGNYARKYDGIDRSGGEQSSDLQNVFPDKQTTIENRMGALDANYRIGSGYGTFCGFTAGYKFKLKGHPTSEYNGQYILTSVSHEAQQNPTLTSDDEIPEPYTNSFTCIAHGSGNPPFKPLRKTPKPTIRGSQTATVVGPSGEEIFTDKYGRVKVQFHWDRAGKYDPDSSCWVRVVQGWAGNKWGSIYIPRIGMEVMIDFLESDPDRPIITGCVYNKEAMPPYTLPDEKTKSTLKSDSTKGGGGFNEFRFEDKKGEEQIFFHAEKDKDIRIKNDRKEIVKNDAHYIVENDLFEKVKGDKHLAVTGDQNEKIDGSFSLTVGSNIQEKAGQKFAVDAGQEIHLKSGTTLTVETGTNLTLKVGGNFININPGGIFIKGTMVMINSGGAAGSGSGSSPDAPKDPLEADTGVPGVKINPPGALPPRKPSSYSQKAQALQNSAKSGTPFCS